MGTMANDNLIEAMCALQQQGYPDTPSASATLPWGCTPYLRYAWLRRKPHPARHWCCVGPCLTYVVATVGPIWTRHAYGEIDHRIDRFDLYGSDFCAAHASATVAYARLARLLSTYGVHTFADLGMLLLEESEAGFTYGS